MKRFLAALLLFALPACGGEKVLPTSPDNAAPATTTVPGPDVTWPQPRPVLGNPLVMPLRVINGVVTDATGHSRIIGYSDFPALRIFEDRPADELATLRAARNAGYQFVRIFYGLAESEFQDGGYWRGAVVSPELAKRQLVPFAQTAREYGIRLVLSGGHNYGSRAAELEFIRWMAATLRDAGLADQIAAFEWRNEWTITSPWGVSSESYSVYREAGTIMAALGCLTSMGAPQENASLISTLLLPSDVGAIDDARGYPPADLMTRALGFARNRPAGRALWVIEPTGPNYGDGDVYVPLDDPGYLLGYYGASLVSGQVLTTFNGGSVRHRRGPETYWGFDELPRVLAYLPVDMGTYTGPTWFTKGNQFALVDAEPWGLMRQPPRPVKSWSIVGPDGIESQGLGPIMPPKAGWHARLVIGEWQ